MASFLKSIDKIGKPFQFNIEGDTYRTPIGGVISILFYFGALILTGYFGRDLYYKADPNFIERTDVSEDYPFQQLNSSNSFIALGIFDGNRSIYNLSYFDMEIAYLENSGFGKPTKYTITQHEKCTEKHIGSQEKFDKLKLHDTYCFNINHSVGGYWENNIVKVPALILRRCNNKTEIAYNITCASDEEVNKIFPRLFILFYYQEQLLIPQNFNDPYIKAHHLQYDIINLTKNEPYHYELFYNNAEITSDTGLIFEDPFYENFIAFDYKAKVVGNMPLFGNYIMMIQLLISKKLKYYTRTYLRLPDVLANTGGFLDLTMVLIEFFYSFYLDNSYTVYLYKKIFKLEIEEECDNNDPNKRKQAIGIELNNINNCINNNNYNNDNSNFKNLDKSDITLNIKDQNNNNINDLNYENISISKPTNYKSARLLKILEKNTSPFNKDLKQIINYKQKIRKEVKISYCERSSYSCCFNSKIKEQILKKELSTLADKIIEQKSDIFELWKTIDQFSLLKKIVLNENQCFMMKKRGIKEIVINSLKQQIKFKKKKVLEKERNDNNMNNLIEYFKLRKEKKKANVIDDLLFNYLEHDIKSKIAEELNKT